MIPGKFDYVAPRSLEEVVAILAERGREAKLLAGGYSLIPVLKLRLAQASVIVDLRHVSGLDYIVEDDQWLRIGGRTTHQEIATNDLVRRRYPILAETATQIGDPQVRNWGTIAGSVVHADPAADWPGALIAAGARFVLRSASGERTVEADAFCLDTFVTACEVAEILTEVQIPRARPREGAAYHAFERKAGDFSTAGVGARVRLDDGRIGAATIGVTAVAPAPFRARRAEEVLQGQAPGEELYRAAGRAVADASRPTADIRGPEDYKRSLAAEMAVRALRRAVDRAMAS